MGRMIFHDQRRESCVRLSCFHRSHVKSCLAWRIPPRICCVPSIGNVKIHQCSGAIMSKFIVQQRKDIALAGTLLILPRVVHKSRASYHPSSRKCKEPLLAKCCWFPLSRCFDSAFYVPCSTCEQMANETGR